VRASGGELPDRLGVCEVVLIGEYIGDLQSIQDGQTTPRDAEYVVGQAADGTMGDKLFKAKQAILGSTELDVSVSQQTTPFFEYTVS